MNLPLTLSGPFAAPAANLNWATASRNLARRKMEDALRGRLGDNAGAIAGWFGKKTEAPAPATSSAAPSIDHATLIVTDAAGGEVERVERLQEVVNYLAAAADRAAPTSIRWDHSGSGRKIAAAKSPLTVWVVVTDSAGKTAEATSEVRR